MALPVEAALAPGIPRRDRRCPAVDAVQHAKDTCAPQKKSPRSRVIAVIAVIGKGKLTADYTDDTDFHGPKKAVSL